LKGILKALEIPVSTWFYHSEEKATQKRGHDRKKLEVELRQHIIRVAEESPWYGYKKIAVLLRKEMIKVSDRQVYRVFREEKLLQKRKKALSLVEKKQLKKLAELLPQKPNDLWQMDVTYIYLENQGWRYAVTVIDYYSRYLLALYLTDSFSAKECLIGLDKARKEAERQRGKLKKPVLLVTDNGSSFTARRFQEELQGKYSHVRIRYRTPTQLGLLERFHGTLKKEEVHWNYYESVSDAREKLEQFRVRYNEIRPHWSLRESESSDPVAPQQVYSGEVIPVLPKWQQWGKRIQEQFRELKSA
jgi:putative transposase